MAGFTRNFGLAILPFALFSVHFLIGCTKDGADCSGENPPSSYGKFWIQNKTYKLKPISPSETIFISILICYIVVLFNFSKVVKVLLLRPLRPLRPLSILRPLPILRPPSILRPLTILRQP